MDRLPKEIEAKYDVLAMMGEGGMGSIYKVRHRFLDEIQVIKLMQAKLQKNPELKARFLREAKTAKQLRHPNIAEVVDYSVTSDGTAYIVMEFVDGANLREVLVRARAPLDPSLVITLGQQSLAAIGYLHRKGLVHRDISPDNLMLTRDEAGLPFVKLIDLGIAKSVEGTHELTRQGKFIGKLQYASPEQFGGLDGKAKVDRRSDLYSFGVVLYELLTDSEPIVGPNYHAVIAGHLHRPPRPFEESDPHNRVPGSLRQIVLKALEKDPGQRFQTAEEFAQALAAFGTARAITAANRALPSAGAALSEDEAWEHAEQLDSLFEWEAFLSAHPNSNRARAARSRLERLEEQEELDWAHAARVGTADAWESYLDRHGASPKASKARRKLTDAREAEREERAWTAASKAATVDGWRDYLAQFPASPRVTAARAELQRVEEFIRERTDWDTAALRDSRSAWEEYLDHHPRSTRTGIARESLKRSAERERELAAWQRAISLDSIEAWSQFLAEFPASERCESARQYLSAARIRAEEIEREAHAWAHASATATSASWRTYIDSFPQSHRTSSAVAELQRLEKIAREQQDWDAAVMLDSTSAWTEFLNRHSDSPRRDDAVAMLRRAEHRDTQLSAWEAAVARDSVDAWVEFLNRFPESDRAKSAREYLDRARQLEERRRVEIERGRAEASAWTRAVNDGSESAWDAYLIEFGDSHHAEEGRVRLKAAAETAAERQAWITAQQQDAVRAYEEFLFIYARSRFAEEARGRLLAARARDLKAAEEREASERKQREAQNAWSEAVAADSIDSYKSFLRRFAETELSVEARSRLTAAEEKLRLDQQRHLEAQKMVEEKAWADASTSDRAEAVEAFLRLYGDSRYASEAQQYLRTLRSRDEARRQVSSAWEEAARCDTSHVYRTFLAQYPESERAAEAKRLLANAIERDEKSAEESRSAERRHRAGKARPAIPATIAESQSVGTSEVVIRPRRSSRIFTFVPFSGGLRPQVYLIVIVGGIVAGSIALFQKPSTVKVGPAHENKRAAAAPSTVGVGELHMNAQPAIVEPGAEKKAFDDAVSQKLQQEMMKLQSEFAKELRQQKSKNAPLQNPAPVTPEAAPSPGPTPPTEEHVPEGAALEVRRVEAQQGQAVPQPESAPIQDPPQAQSQPQPQPQPKALSASIPAVAPTPSVEEGDVIEFSDLDTPPRPLSPLRATYPPLAQHQRAEASIIITALVSENGNVIDVKVLKGDPRFGFNDEAIRAIRATRFSTPMKGGKRVRSWCPLTINFKLEPAR